MTGPVHAESLSIGDGTHASGISLDRSEPRRRLITLKAPSGDASSASRVSMATVRFQSQETHLHLCGSDAFVWRQLRLLAPFLGPVDLSVAFGATEGSGGGVPSEPADTVAAAAAVADGAPEQARSLVWSEPAAGDVPGPNGGPPEPARPGVPAAALEDFFRSVRGRESVDQTEAALLFAYFLQHDQGRDGVTLSDLLQCCIRAGVDSRNFHEVLQVLEDRGHLERGPAGSVYRLSPTGAAAVEERIA